jgi:sulfonate transport system permease protein
MIGASARSRTLYLVALRGWLPVVLLIAWWLATENSQSVYFPPLRDIAATFRQDWLFSRIGTDLVPSVARFGTGFLIAAALGVVLGTILGLNATVKRFADPIVQFLRSVPPPAFLPVALLLFGITDTMNIAIIVIGAIWPTLLNTADGVRSINPQMKDMSRSYRLSRGQQLIYVTLPGAAPQIFAGLRTTLQLSIVLIVVSEMVGAVNGVGFYVLNAQQTFAIRETWAGTIVLGFLGYFATMLFLLIEKCALAWHHGIRQTQEIA